MEIDELKEKIEGAIIDIDNLQQEIFGHDEYINWIYYELEKIKIRLKEKQLTIEDIK